MHSVNRRLGSSLEIDRFLLCYYYLAIILHCSFSESTCFSHCVSSLSLSVSAVFTVVRRMRRRLRCMNMITMDQWPRQGNDTSAKHAGHEKRYTHRHRSKQLKTCYLIQSFIQGTAHILNRNCLRIDHFQGTWEPFICITVWFNHIHIFILIAGDDVHCCGICYVCDKLQFAFSFIRMRS